jgi:hypothetical protein
MNIFRQRRSITNHASHHMGTMRRGSTSARIEAALIGTRLGDP